MNLKKIHSDKYDYSLVEYKNNFTKVCVICKKHGKFMNAPSHHKNGVKCWRCSYEERALNKIQKDKNDEAWQKASGELKKAVNICERLLLEKRVNIQ